MDSRVRRVDFPVVTGEPDHRVELPQFSGPLELLLHLLGEAELSVAGIEVARVCDRFLEHLKQLERIDIDAAGDFLVMASTLMRLKSQSMLPADEQILDDDDLDPRFELVRQLIEYRRFKRAAEKLDERREAFALRFPRGMHPELSDHPPVAEPAPVDARGTTVEQLFAAFARLLKQTTGPSWVIPRDDTPMAEHMARLEMLFTPGRRLRFLDLVDGPRSRTWVVGVFLALLELIKRGLVLAIQETEFGEIEIVVHETPVENAPQRPDEQRPGDHRPTEHQPASGAAEEPSA
ncbi:MAG: segregation/condensation protein A [Planctomycetes bacterium]|nr:segregation/condensation protein A [Planctomycetota bacterium]